MDSFEQLITSIISFNYIHYVTITDQGLEPKQALTDLKLSLSKSKRKPIINIKIESRLTKEGKKVKKKEIKKESPPAP